MNKFMLPFGGGQHLKELQDSKEQIEEKVNRNSENSHSPPASDAPKKGTEAVSGAVEVQSAAIAGADGTGFGQGNADGQNLLSPTPPTPDAGD